MISTQRTLAQLLLAALLSQTLRSLPALTHRGCIASSSPDSNTIRGDSANVKKCFLRGKYSKQHLFMIRIDNPDKASVVCMNCKYNNDLLLVAPLYNLGGEAILTFLQ